MDIGFQWFSMEFKWISRASSEARQESEQLGLWFRSLELLQGLTRKAYDRQGTGVVLAASAVALAPQAPWRHALWRLVALSKSGLAMARTTLRSSKRATSTRPARSTTPTAQSKASAHGKRHRGAAEGGAPQAILLRQGSKTLSAVWI